jgi:hypothetical protein
MLTNPIAIKKINSGENDDICLILKIGLIYIDIINIRAGIMLIIAVKEQKCVSFGKDSSITAAKITKIINERTIYSIERIELGMTRPNNATGSFLIIPIT